MKKITKFIAGSAALLGIICSFAACGNNQSTETPSGADTTPTGESIVIGCTGPLTGDASSYGISVKQGAELAVKEINAAGGVNGINFNFIMKDDKATEQDAATAYDQLMDEGMQISIGSVTSGSCLSFASKSAEDNVFFITPSASNADVIQNPNGFRICFGDPDQGILAAQELTAKYTKIGCLYDSSDAYSMGIYEAFKAEMEKLGKTFTTASFDKENNKDFSTQVETFKDCEVIFTPFYYTEAGLVARTCASKGVNAVIFGCDGLDGIAGQIDETVKNNISYITPFDVNSTDAKIAKFVADYKAVYGADPDQFAADGYDAIYTIYNGLVKADFKDAKMSASDLCDLITATITAEGFEYAGVTGTMTWDVSGAPTKTPNIVTVQ